MVCVSSSWFYPLLSSRIHSPVEVCSLSRAKDYSSGSIQKHLQGQLSKPHDTFSILFIPTLFLLPGRSFAGTWEAVDGRHHRWGSLAGLHAKAGLRMDGVRSLCKFKILSSKRSRLDWLVNLTVDSDARWECRVSNYPRCYRRPSVPSPSGPMDQTISCSNYEFHFIGV